MAWRTSIVAKIALVLITMTLLQHTLSDQRICGPAIDQVLNLMCPFGTNPHETKRNSIAEGSLENNNDEENFAFSFDMMPHWTSMEANTLAKIRRRRQGIYHECCLKPCSKNELMSYCRPS